VRESPASPAKKTTRSFVFVAKSERARGCHGGEIFQVDRSVLQLYDKFVNCGYWAEPVLKKPTKCVQYSMYTRLAVDRVVYKSRGVDKTGGIFP
jgi:hypothetical protein